MLSTDRGLVLIDGKIAVSISLRGKVLCFLHSAHQGVVGMKAHASDSVYRPSMNTSINNFRAKCLVCTNITLIHPHELITITPAPDWPF